MNVSARSGQADPAQPAAAEGTASLREQARRILARLLEDVHAGASVRRALGRDSDTLLVGGEERLDLRALRQVVPIAAGKAAPAMMEAALEQLGERVVSGTLVTKHRHGRRIPGVEVWEAGHPLPDACGLAAAAGALAEARRASAADLVLVLLSGGASALWPAPPDGVTLGDLRQTTRALLRSGAAIAEMNAVRKHLSRLAGGQLARAAAPARVLTLAISDVVGDALDTIGSGPTTPDPTTFADALAVVRARGVALPAAVLEHLRAGAAGRRCETPKAGDAIFARASAHVIARNRDALAAAARAAEAAGFAAHVIDGAARGEARALGRRVAERAFRARGARRPVALLWGGETTVTVRGEGSGGRNGEVALAAATALDGEPGVVVAALGTDGSDGPTDAAGGMVDGGTLLRGWAVGLDPLDHLARNDSHSYLSATGDLLVTGPTDTHVNDVVLALVDGSPLSSE